MKKEILTSLKVADEVWIASALLHREHPEATDFSIGEIVDRARREGLLEPLRPGVYVHVVQHCVANRRPNPGRYRMLFETSEGRRRLFRKGDPYNLEREGAKTKPEPEGLPPMYSGLLSWYQDWCNEALRSIFSSIFSRARGGFRLRSWRSGIGCLLVEMNSSLQQSHSVRS